MIRPIPRIADAMRKKSNTICIVAFSFVEVVDKAGCVLLCIVIVGDDEEEIDGSMVVSDDLVVLFETDEDDFLDNGELNNDFMIGNTTESSTSAAMRHNIGYAGYKNLSSL